MAMRYTKANAGIRTSGPADGWRRHLGAVSRVIQASSKVQIAAIAETLVREARQRAPVETGNLEQAITLKTGKGGWEHDVGIDEVAAPYAVYMHEGMGEGSGEPYVLGPLSEAKSEGPPHQGKGVGMRFMPRAWEYVYRKFIHASADLKRSVVSAVLEKVGEAQKSSRYRAGFTDADVQDVKRKALDSLR